MNDDPEPSRPDLWLATMIAVALVLFVLLWVLGNGWLGL